MGRFSFVHAADLHLDTPFAGIARTTPDVAAALREASLEAFDGLVALTIERKAAALLLAGDLYDGPERGVRAQLRFHAGLERLSSAGVATFVVHGNHDPLDGWSAISSWPERTTIFGCEKVESAPLRDAAGKHLATIHGISYRTRDTTTNLAATFRRSTGPEFQIGLLHASIGTRAEHAPYAPCTVEDLVRSGLDYWALGHIHRREIVRSANPCVIYPGNLQGRSSKPSEEGEKGAMVVTVEDGRILQTEFAAVDRVRFRRAEVDVTGVESIGEIHRRVGDSLSRQRGRDLGRGLIVAVRLAGRTIAHSSLRRPEVISDLLQHLRDGMKDEEPFCWIDRIDVATGTPLDFTSLARRDDLVGHIARVAIGGRGLMPLPETGDIAELFRYDTVREVLAEQDLDAQQLAADAADIAIDLLLENEGS